MSILENNTSRLQQILEDIETLPTAPSLPELDNPGDGNKMLEGYKLIGQNGEVVTGTIPVEEGKTVTPGETEQVAVESGTYVSGDIVVAAVEKVEEVEQATPVISVTIDGIITARATQSAGKVAAGTKTATKQMTVQAAKTWTPGATNQTIASGRYLTGTQTIKGDANLKAENIVSGVSIFGVAGTAETGTGGGSETGAACTVHIDNSSSYPCAVCYANSDGEGKAVIVNDWTSDQIDATVGDIVTFYSPFDSFAPPLVCEVQGCSFLGTTEFVSGMVQCRVCMFRLTSENADIFVYDYTGDDT